MYFLRLDGLWCSYLRADCYKQRKRLRYILAHFFTAWSLCRCSEYKMQQLDSFCNLSRATKSHKVFVTCTGCRFVNGSSTNCVFWCTMQTTTDHQYTLVTLPLHAVQPCSNLVSVRHRPPTTSSHVCQPSSENVHFLLRALTLRTIYLVN